MKSARRIRLDRFCALGDMQSVPFGTHLYSIFKCPVCEARYAVAPGSGGAVLVVWPYDYPLSNPIAMMTPPVVQCMDCLFRRQEIVECTLHRAAMALTASGRWLDLTNSLLAGLETA